jgi:hypothetical protein
MFKKGHASVWIAILVLSCMYLMGQVHIESVAPAPVAKTGQTTSYYSGDDGDIQAGQDSPIPRFTVIGDGTVTDNLTGKIWTQDADCYGTNNWTDALDHCNALADGTCGLSDGSQAGDWRLANVKELLSVVDFGNNDPALPTGHPFTDILSEWYWSSSTQDRNTGYAWRVRFMDGEAGCAGKGSGNHYYVWCVRDPYATTW